MTCTTWYISHYAFIYQGEASRSYLREVETMRALSRMRASNCYIIKGAVSSTCPNSWGFRSGGWSSLADILLPTWWIVCQAALDIHVISPIQDLTIYAATSTPCSWPCHECGHACSASWRPTCLIAVPLGWILLLLLLRFRVACLRKPTLLFGQLGRPSPNVLALTIPLQVLVSFFTSELSRCGGGMHTSGSIGIPCTLLLPVEGIIWLLADHLLPFLLIIPTISNFSYISFVITLFAW